jgi:hypothetical protein
MEHLYLVGGLALGTTLVALGVLSAVVYTPYGYSLLDTAVTAFTGSTLQVGNLFVVAAVTALSFDFLASAFDVQFSMLVPATAGYLVFHLLVYRSSIAVTSLQGTPVDPDVVLSRDHLASFLPSLPFGGRQDRDA